MFQVGGQPRTANGRLMDSKANNTRRNLTFVLTSAVLAALLPGGLIEAGFAHFYFGRYCAFLQFLNRLPEPTGITAMSNVFYGGNRLDFGLYAVLFFKLLPLIFFLEVTRRVVIRCRYSLGDLGLSWSLGQEGSVRSLIILMKTTAAFLLFYGTLLAIYRLLGIEYHFLWRYPVFDLRQVSGLIAPLYEELIFRGIILAALLHHLSPGRALLLSCVVFGVAHILVQSVYAMVFTAILGLYLGWIYYRTRSLVLPVIAHFLYNIFGMFVYMRVSIPNH